MPEADAYAAFSARLSDLSRPDVGDPNLVLEVPEAFVHTAPDFFADFSGLGRGGAPIWGKPRHTHGTLLRRVTPGLLFGSSHIIDRNGCCMGSSLAYRGESLRLLTTNMFQHFFPGNRPGITFEGNEACIDVAAMPAGSIRELPDPVFLATAAEPDNWGRWISQVIPRLTYYRELPAGRKLLVRARHDWQKSILAFFDIDPAMVIDHDPGAAYYCADITAIQHTVGDLTVTARERSLYRRLGIECAWQRGAGSGRRIFVSRMSVSRRHPHYRVLREEAELAAELQQLGFAIVEPEQLSFADQIATFWNAEIVVGLGGAGIFNVVFCRDGSRIVDIESSGHYITSHTGIFASRGLRYGVVYGKPERDQVNACWSLDVEAAVGLIRDYILSSP